MFKALRKKIKGLFSLPDGIIYHGTYDGHRVYYFKSIDNLTKFREMAIRLAYHQLELGVKLSDLRALIELGQESVNKGDLAKIGTLFSYLEMQIDNYASERVILQVAGCGVLIDGEPLDDFTNEHEAIKTELLQKHPQLRAFFLTTSLRYLTELGSNLTGKDEQALLNNPARLTRELLFLKLISIDLYQGLQNPSTMKYSGWKASLAEFLRKSFLPLTPPNTTND